VSLGGNVTLSSALAFNPLVAGYVTGTSPFPSTLPPPLPSFFPPLGRGPGFLPGKIFDLADARR
jgi:hypothetical protein